MQEHKRHSGKAGLPPGTMVHIGKTITKKAEWRAIIYNADHASEIKLENIRDIQTLHRSKEDILWLDVIGIDHVEVIEEIGKAFNLHPLMMEDIVNTEQRPKFEEFEGYTFFTLKSAKQVKKTDDLRLYQVSMVLGENFILSFREEENTIFDAVRDRLLMEESRARKKKTDFLAYLLIDSVVDGYYSLIEKISDDIEDLEEAMLKDVNGNSIKQFQHFKRSLVVFLKALYPLREALSKLDNRDNPLLDIENLPFFRDVYDHTIHIIESVENERDILAGVMDIYLSALNTRMNSIMKVLTIIATIFIPLSFFASVYGMNFDNFPEIHWRYGYLFFWILILLIFTGMMIYFKRKKWL